MKRIISFLIKRYNKVYFYSTIFVGIIIFIKKVGFYMQELNLNIIANGREIHWHHKKRKRQETGKHRQDFYEICLVLDGVAKNEINGRNYYAYKNEIIFINKNIIHEIVSTDEKISLKYINIAFGELCMEHIKTIFPQFMVTAEIEKYVLQPEKVNSLINLYSNINLNLSYQEAVMEVELFLYHMVKEILCANLAHNKMYPKWFENILERFEEVETLNMGVKYIFEISPYSKAYTIKQFKMFINESPSEYVNHRRIDYATYLLETSKTSITDICYEVGFNNIEYFDRVFKKYKGFTPLKYRQQINRMKKEEDKD